MKPMLHLKTVLVLLYVALCTHLVLSVLAADMAPDPAPQIGGE